MGAIGAGAGFVVARELALKDALARLASDAASGLQTADSYAGFTRRSLVAMNASPYGFCSEAELSYFRRLLYESSFLKEAGRIRGGSIACSAVVGSVALNRLPAKPGLVSPDGLKFYWSIPAFRIPGEPIVAVAFGDAYVVADFRLRSEEVPAAVHLNVQMRGAANTKTDSRESNGGAYPAADSQTIGGDTLSATRCSTRFSPCVTASLAVSDAKRIERNSVLMVTSMSGLAGAAFGLLWILFDRRNSSMKQQLRRAIAKGKIRLVYQPIADVVTGRLAGAEALARWTGEDGFAISPEVFVRVAEERCFVGELTRYVVNLALDEFAPVIRSYPHLRLSVNVAAGDLSDPTFLPMLDAAMKRTAVPCRNLIIELTETSTVCRDKAIKTIRALRAAGHPVHIDDFGTGYSSLAYLNELAVDAIKIDRSFTRYIGTDSVTVGILPQILAMAEALNLLVIVEGIETPDQAAYFLNSRTPVLGQGWLFGRPAPINEFVRLVAAKERRSAPERVVEEEAELALP